MLWYIYILYILLLLLLLILLLTVRKCLLRVGVRCVQCNHQKFHFSIHTGHRCYSKNERLGRLSYYYINFFSFHFVWTATLDCNFFFFFSLSSQFNLYSLFLLWVYYEDSLFYTVFSGINHSFKEAVVESGDKSSIRYIFTSLFVNNAYFRVQ